MSKLLTIAIPTYNRADKLDNQLHWLHQAIRQEDFDTIELAVLDNHSSDHTPDVCQKWKAILGDKIIIIRNEQNLGLVGNYLKGVTIAQGLFYWGIGDDDKLDSMLIQKLIDEIRQKEHQNITLIHINHRCIDGATNEIIHPKLYESFQEDTLINGIEGLEKLIESRHSGGFMFITANILHTKTASAFIQSNPVTPDFSLSYPLLLSLYLASKGKFLFIENPYIDCFYHVSSWRKHAIRVLEYEVPNVFYKIIEYGYSPEWVVRNVPKPFALNDLKTGLSVLKQAVIYQNAEALIRLKALYRYLLFLTKKELNLV